MKSKKQKYKVEFTSKVTGISYISEKTAVSERGAKLAFWKSCWKKSEATINNVQIA